MKKTILLATMFLSLGFFYKANAQVSVSINIGSQPAWGPSGYDHADYYYIPDADMYYYVPTRQFVYMQNNQWIYANNVPYAYRNLDLYNCYKVVVNAPKPYLNNAYYRQQYANYRGWNRPQPMIRDNRDNRQYQRNDYPQHREVYRNTDDARRYAMNDNRGNDSRGNDNRGGNNNQRGGNNDHKNDNRGRH